MKRHFQIGLFLLQFITAGIFSVSGQNSFPGVELISGKEMIETVKLLAAPDMAGRQPGSPGYALAVDLVKSRFETMGLKPAGEDGYLQHVPSEYVEISENPEFSVIRTEGAYKYTLGTDFVCRGLTGFGDVTAPVVFCGYGISEPGAGYDDYAGVDVKGKIVLVFKQNPEWTIAGVDLSQKYNRYRANKAAAHGAIGILLVSTPLSKDPQRPIGSLMDGEGNYDPEMPQMHISLDVARDLFKGSPVQLSELQHRIDSLKQPQSVQLQTKAHMIIRGEYVPEKTSDNVVGLIEGTDPKLKNQYLVISAHLDHVGKQGPEFYFPGANDNASGSAAVLALAKAFAKSTQRPERSVIFVLYTGEEQGLVGSHYFADHCPVEMDQIIAAINLDCIGFGDSIQVGGGKSNPVLWNAARSLDSLNAKRMIKATWGGGGADLDALFKKGIPGLYFASRYSYTHLHLPSDTPETLNPWLYEELVRLAYRTARIVADGKYEKEKLKP